jgi:hypothetical protein
VVAGGGDPSGRSGVVIYLQQGQTLKQAVDNLPPQGGTVMIGAGTWVGGYDSATEPIDKPDITIQGAGQPGYNSAFTSMSGGTIVQGRIIATTGANNLTIRDLDIDVGSDYISSHSLPPLDGLAIANNGQVLGAPQVQSPDIENVSCLGSGPYAPVHCMLIENVNNARVRNITTVLNVHGLAFKGTNSTVEGVFARGHGNDSFIFKSDDYAPASYDHISGVNIHYLRNPGDTKGIYILGLERPVTGVSIRDVTIEGVAEWGVIIQGVGLESTVSNIDLSSITISYPGGSPPGDSCVWLANFVSNISITDMNCSNFWTGIESYAPAAGVFTGFTVLNSDFVGIATNAIQTYGDWTVDNSNFQSVAGDGIVNAFGVTNLSADTFSSIGGQDLDAAGGVFNVAPQ